MNRNTKICVSARVTEEISEVTYYSPLNMLFVYVYVAKVNEFNHTRNADIRIIL